VVRQQLEVDEDLKNGRLCRSFNFNFALALSCGKAMRLPEVEFL